MLVLIIDNTCVCLARRVCSYCMVSMRRYMLKGREARTAAMPIEIHHKSNLNLYHLVCLFFVCLLMASVTILVYLTYYLEKEMMYFLF